MKKLFPIIISLILVLSACGLPGANAEPTAIVVPTAVPEAVSVNPTLAPESGEPGSERKASGDGMIQVYIPAGKFQMGGFDDDAQTDERPTHDVNLNAFWMDKLEVTNGMYQICVKDGACTAPRDVKSATHPSYYDNPDFSDFPVIFVNWQDAANYCQWAGRRLPTEAEWEYAARGSTDTRRMPWGEQSPDNTRTNYDFQAKDTVRVGSFPKGASPFGVLDMAGNVWEWVQDFYSTDFYNQTGDQNPTGPKGMDGGRKVMRGGSWADGFKELRVSNRGFGKSPDMTADSKSEAFMGEANNRTGFRCAADGK